MHWTLIGCAMLPKAPDPEKTVNIEPFRPLAMDMWYILLGGHTFPVACSLNLCDLLSRIIEHHAFPLYLVPGQLLVGSFLCR